MGLCHFGESEMRKAACFCTDMGQGCAAFKQICCGIENVRS